MLQQTYTNGASTRPDECKPQANVPELISLASLDHSKYESKVAGAEDRHRYRLTDGRTLFVPQSVSHEFQRLLQPGEEVWLTRKSRGPWLIEACTNEDASPMPPAAPRARHQHAPPPVPAPAATTTPLQVAPRPAAAPAPPPPSPAAPAPEPYATPAAQLAAPMVLALQAAIIAAKEAQSFASSLGCNLPLGADAVRALAITMYIERSKGGNR